MSRRGCRTSLLGKGDVHQGVLNYSDDRDYDYKPTEVEGCSSGTDLDVGRFNVLAPNEHKDEETDYEGPEREPHQGPELATSDSAGI